MRCAQKYAVIFFDEAYLTSPPFWLQAAVYKICKEMYCEGMEDVPVFEEPDLIGDR